MLDVSIEDHNCSNNLLEGKCFKNEEVLISLSAPVVCFQDMLQYEMIIYVSIILLLSILILEIVLQYGYAKTRWGITNQNKKFKLEFIQNNDKCSIQFTVTHISLKAARIKEFQVM